MNAQFPYIHANNCAGCNLCCGAPCPLDFLSPLSCGVVCPDTVCVAPDQVWKAGDLIGLDANKKAVLWVVPEFGAIEFVGVAQHSVVSDANGNVINNRIMTSFAPNCNGCQVNVFVQGSFDQNSISRNSKQILEDAIADGLLKRRHNYIIL